MQLLLEVKLVFFEQSHGEKTSWYDFYLLTMQTPMGSFAEETLRCAAPRQGAVLILLNSAGV